MSDGRRANPLSLMERLNAAAMYDTLCSPPQPDGSLALSATLAPACVRSRAI